MCLRCQWKELNILDKQNESEIEFQIVVCGCVDVYVCYYGVLKAGWKGASHVVHLCMTVCVVVRLSLVCNNLSGCSPFLGADEVSTLCVCVSVCMCMLVSLSV